MLTNKVAVVTGATRGAGKGIALALGDAGATVYVTGRSSRNKPPVAAPLKGTTIAAPGTVEDTAEEVTRRGGRGIPVIVDHSDESAVKALFDQVAAEQQGRLDVLVNVAWGGNELAIDMQPFWELSAQHWDHMFTCGVKAAVLSSSRAAPLMIAQGSGLIVNVSFWDDDKYITNLYYDLAKAALNRMAFGMAQDLQQHQIAALALSPGWLRTERVLAAFGCSATFQDIYEPPPESRLMSDSSAAAVETQTAAEAKHWTEVPDLQGTESPLYLGRAVVALANESDAALRYSKAGKPLTVADLARQFGYTDIDGRQPDRFKL